MTSPAQPKTLRIAYMVHARSKSIIEEFSDGSSRRVRKPRSTAAMDRKRKNYGSAWRAVKPNLRP